LKIEVTWISVTHACSAVLIAFIELTRAELTLDLDVIAFHECGREGCESSEDDNPVPFGVGIPFAGIAIFPRVFRGK